MNKLMSLVLTVVMVLGSVSLIACGGGGEEGGTTPPPSEGETAPPKDTAAIPAGGIGPPPTPEEMAPPSSEEEVTPPSGGGFTWNDMPVYPGADQIQKGSRIIPSGYGKGPGRNYIHPEWRYYETRDSAEKVIAFYKSQMPGKGWIELPPPQFREKDLSWLKAGATPTPTKRTIRITGGMMVMCGLALAPMKSGPFSPS